MNRWIAGLAALCLCLPLSAETLSITETTQGKTVHRTTTLTRSEEGGMTWVTAASTEGISRTATLPSGELRVFEWTAADQRVVLTSDGTTLRVSGTSKGKALSGSLELKGRAWSLDFDQPLKQFAAKGLTGSMPFLMINPEDLAHPAEMQLTKEAEETLGGQPVVRVKVGLTGALSLFWSAKVWADATGFQKKYQGTKGPGTPESVITVESLP